MKQPLYRDNIQVRYDILVEALRAIQHFRSSAFRTYAEDIEYFRSTAIQALRDAGEDE